MKSAVINFIAYYVFGIPSGAILTFALHFKVSSLITLWSGMAFGLTVAAFTSLLIVSRWKWVDIAAEIANRQNDPSSYVPLN